MSHFIILILSILKIVLSQNRGRESTSQDFIILKVDRTVDLREPLINIQSEILFKSNKIDPMYNFRYPVLKNAGKNIINLNAKFKSLSGDEETISMKVTKQMSKSEDIFEYYDINFKNEAMNHEEERILHITEDYFERFELLPKKITLKEDQYVLFQDTINQLSFYAVERQSIKVILKQEKGIM